MPLMARSHFPSISSVYFANTHLILPQVADRWQRDTGEQKALEKELKSRHEKQRLWECDWTWERVSNHRNMRCADAHKS